MTSLEVAHLSGGYGSLRVLWDVSLKVGEGEAAVVVGPNGAGKSTLFAGIAGALPTYAGNISVSGTDVSGYSSERRLRTGLAWVPEGRNVFQHLTVRDNLRMSATLAGTLAAYESEEAAVCELFPAMAEKIDTAAGTLSGGQQQILAIARALVRQPTVVLLDEPTIGLAPSIVERLGEAVHETKQRGVSWVIAEQNLGWLSDIADRTYVLQGGRIAAQGGPELISSRDAVRRAFFESASSDAPLA